MSVFLWVAGVFDILLSPCSVSLDGSCLYVSKLLLSHFVCNIKHKEIGNFDPLPTYYFMCSPTQ